MIMNFKSQICTTKEQSERLTALGLMKETADMKYPCTREYYGGVLTEGTSSLPVIIDTEDDDITEYDIPAWSLHRLIEIYSKGTGNYSFFFPDVYESIIQDIEYAVFNGYLDLNYLMEEETEA